MAMTRSVTLGRRRLLVDGRPDVVFSGEVHYFRLAAAEWTDRLDRVVDAGCTAVATYIPWLVHELPDGSLDFDGRTGEHRDLTSFLALAAERDLLVIARPGPFVMAELKNEGIPYRVYAEHPHVHPVGWDGRPVTTRTIDYLAPDFLAEVEHWYAGVMPVLADRLVTRGGPVAAVQLDNEIGMLSWVSNSPDLTDNVLTDFAEWCRVRHGRNAAQRYGADPDDPPAWRDAVRSPSGPGSLALHHDLGDYHRDRYTRYVAFLRTTAEKHGVRDVPFLINLHGTGEGRGRTYPIGISQLYRSYRGQPQMTSGSDHYVGDLTVENAVDLYVGNAFMAAVHDADQPLTSLEFEAGSGDYGEDLGSQVPPSAVDLKTRLFVAQGNRLINYYLFAGGVNPPLDVPVGDGNDRIAFTGERHGFAAPIGPEGAPNLTYPATRDVVHAVRGAAHLLADMDEEYDDLVLGFVPDHYLTEYRHPADAERAALVADLERFRGMGCRDIPARALLLAGFSFPAVDLQHPDGFRTDAVLVLASAPTLSREVQQRVADHVTGGGRLLLAGLLPQWDVDGTRCTVLADALGLVAGTRVDGDAERFPSVRGTGWLSGRPEVRVGVLQHLSAIPGVDPGADAEPFVTDVSTGEAVAMEVRPGAGHALVVSCDYPCHLEVWTQLLARLGSRPRHTHDAPHPGIVVTSTVDHAGQRVVHLLNLAPVDQSFTLSRHGQPLLDGRRLELPAKSGLMLPEAVRQEHGVLAWSTCELAGQHDDAVSFRRHGTGDAAAFDADGTVTAPGASVRRSGRRHIIEWPDDPSARGSIVRAALSHPS